MNKAYDRVEWNFLEAAFLNMGFDNKVVDLIMSCVSSVRYQITHSGRSFGNICPHRGVRQGDPLSSYLFLICIKGLTSQIQKYERRRLIAGIRVARSAPPITHMFFADNSYVFCKANKETAQTVLSILHIFETASGINKRAIFGFLKDKLQDCIRGWDKKLFSKGGKEILLKSVAQTLPSYAMSVFLLPLELCREIERLMCKFWWKTDSKKDKCIHWKSWENMSVRKSNGGMDFRCLRDFNLALLGNQSWRLILHPNTLVNKIFKSRYYPQDSFLSAKLGNNPSYIWRSLMETQPILKQGVSCRIGNGRPVNVLEDPCPLVAMFSRQCGDIEKIATMCWMLWKARNDLDDGLERWEPPRINSVKINSDAAIFAESSYYSYAFIIRNHDGELVEARSKCSYG
ncbi:uncharacterized protein LOC141686402 [Apium graveolens]|uniref:uncharacterized protein LOC141686402 n=1 Tax=Apium graveolens TaxID=4045 RepID=UPI003D7A4720